MGYRDAIGITAALLALANAIPYCRSILAGRTRPSRSAYTIWLVIDGVLLASYLGSGARETGWTFMAFTATTVIIFLFSLRYGMGGVGRLDLACLAIAAVAIVAWIATDDPVPALFLVLAARLAGYPPVLRKARHHPETEDLLAWTMTGAASVLTLGAIAQWRPEIVIAPLSYAIADVLVVTLLIAGHRVGAEGGRR